MRALRQKKDIAGVNAGGDRLAGKRLRIAAFAALFVVLMAAPAAAAAASSSHRDVTVRIGEDITIAQGDSVGVVVAVGGDVRVAGTVRQTAVAVGGDVILLPTARVGLDRKSREATVVSVGGKVVRDQGAQMGGKVVQVSAGKLHKLLSWHGWWRAAHPFAVTSVIGWIFQTMGFIALAVVLAVIMPRQIAAVTSTLAGRPLPSLGWGALGAVVSAPLGLLALAALLITIVGILLVPFLVLGLLLLGLFSFLVAATTLGQRVLALLRGEEPNLLMAAAVGVVVANALRMVPWAGGLANLALVLMGLGATIVAFATWRRTRRLAPAEAPASGGAQTPQPPAPEDAELTST
jgi:hypothetical protein